MDFDWDVWYDIFAEKVRKLGYVGPIDKGYVQEEYFGVGRYPEAAAKLFWDSMEEEQ
jgi:hypothetical protein